MERCLYYILDTCKTRGWHRKMKIKLQLEIKGSDKTWKQRGNKNLCQLKRASTSMMIYQHAMYLPPSWLILAIAFSEAIEGYNESWFQENEGFAKSLWENRHRSLMHLFSCNDLDWKTYLRRNKLSLDIQTWNITHCSFAAFALVRARHLLVSYISQITLNSLAKPTV